MRTTEIFALFALCGVLSFVAADLTFSIKESKTPNLQYEVDAIEFLKEAYVLYPEDNNKRNDAFSKLFQNQHADTHGWNIAEGCLSLYTPNSTVYVDISVVDDAGTETIVKIFN